MRLDGPRRQHDCWPLRQIASLTIHYISEPKDLVNNGNVEHGSKMSYENHYINHIKAIPIQSLSRIPLLLPQYAFVVLKAFLDDGWKILVSWLMLRERYPVLSGIRSGTLGQRLASGEQSSGFGTFGTAGALGTC